MLKKATKRGSVTTKLKGVDPLNTLVLRQRVKVGLWAVDGEGRNLSEKAFRYLVETVLLKGGGIKAKTIGKSVDPSAKGDERVREAYAIDSKKNGEKKGNNSTGGERAEWKS